MSELVILGSGTGVPSLRRASPGFLLISGDSKVLIDSGSGTLRRMLEAGINYLDLDLLLYTHTHPDHTADLVPLLFANKYGDMPRRIDLVCMAGPGFQRYFDKLKAVYGSWIEALSYHFILKETSDHPFVFRGLKIFSKSTAHLPESVGYRIELKDGKTIAFSGDTDYCTNLVDLAHEVDLLVLECSFPDEKKVDGHLTPSWAGRIGLESRCRKLLLTHLYPICDQYDILKQCKSVFPGDLLLAEDLMRVAV